MATSATYPPPPPYYKLYKDYLEDPNSAPPPPPPLPEGTSYTLFGATYTTDNFLPSLEEQGVRQLYPKVPNIDFKKELRELNRELQLNFLELADALVERPSQYARRVEEISLIFKNLHHLLNSLRPHQARATLIHILELQIQRRKQAIEDIKREGMKNSLQTLPASFGRASKDCLENISLVALRRREEGQRLLKESLQIFDSQSG